MLGLVTAFLALGWWQLSRARAGNLLSFAYAVEWPVFAAFVIFVWVKEIRLELRRDRPAPPPPAAVPDELANLPGYVPFRAEPPRTDQVPAEVTPGAAAGVADGDPELVAY